MANKGNSMKSSKDIIDKIEEIQKGLCLLGRNRKIVLSHHKAFELTDDLEKKSTKSEYFLKNESYMCENYSYICGKMIHIFMEK